jgi:hypothetical protein
VSAEANTRREVPREGDFNRLKYALTGSQPIWAAGFWSAFADLSPVIQTEACRVNDEA